MFAKIENISGEQAAWVIERYAAWVAETPGVWAVTVASVDYTKEKVDLHLVVHADLDQALTPYVTEEHLEDPTS